MKLYLAAVIEIKRVRAALLQLLMSANARHPSNAWMCVFGFLILDSNQPQNRVQMIQELHPQRKGHFGSGFKLVALHLSRTNPWNQPNNL